MKCIRCMLIVVAILQLAFARTCSRSTETFVTEQGEGGFTNAKDLKLLGITKKSQLNKIFEQAIIEGEVVSTQTGVYGTTVMRQVNIGQYGCIDVGFFYPSNNILATS